MKKPASTCAYAGGKIDYKSSCVWNRNRLSNKFIKNNPFYARLSSLDIVDNVLIYPIYRSEKENNKCFMGKARKIIFPLQRFDFITKCNSLDGLPGGKEPACLSPAKNPKNIKSATLLGVPTLIVGKSPIECLQDPWRNLL